ncbi:alanyl-tRNA editing protein [Sediminispirochaeta smaragdinae]|uniref:Alanyl-tRNA synthetase, class IIc n=1 Tax=Sediminispirochaeta smaragdinae (strain DSM 11293 / JCM 15392 / SEBR 4228) TaxID=573413 RepID=E1RCD3_SEDSS|nr:DHHA1 domain-containing protein [Sediminispirochaeta smaragdinae]ADK80013.1 Alanyl-tRNA synthetase, class IIc [Sediminispirochaeta smaragdinae DSM 11293]
MTEKLYYQNQYQSEFKAAVLSSSKTDKGYEVLLDKTQFYPEGGGQPSDTGWIGEQPLLDVKKVGSDVVHLLQNRPAEGPVLCRLDWNHRFDYMQQHTAQHILSAVLYREFGINTLAVHLGEDFLTIEVDREEIDEGVLEKVDFLAQELVCRNLPIETFWTDDEKVASFDLRRTPKVSGHIRIVRLGNYDAVACGGVHCSKTGEVLLIRRCGVERIRGHMRIQWKAGGRAFRDYGEKMELVTRLCELNSVKSDELEERSRQLIAEQQRLKVTIESLRREQAAAEARNLSEQAAKASFLSRTFVGQEKDFLRNVADALTGEKPLLVALTNKTENGVQWLVAALGGLDFPFNELRKELLSAIDGKGGGKAPMWQGIGSNPEGIEAFYERCRKAL